MNPKRKYPQVVKALAKTGTKPYRFQWDCLEEIDNYNGRAIVGLDMGLGKSLISLMFAHSKKMKGPIVIVCPAALKEHWKREVDKHFGERAQILNGRKPQRLPRGNKYVWIINYEILGVPHNQNNTWTEELRKIRPSLVITDEGHRIKEGRAKCSKAWKFLCKAVKYILVLTGTPIINRPIEIFNPCAVVRPLLFPSRYAFGIQFCRGFQSGFGGWDFSGSSNLPELNCILRNEILVRRRKEEVLRDLPKVTTTMIPLDLPPKAMRDYQHAVDDFLSWMKENGFKKASRFSNATATAFQKIGYLKRNAAKHKLPQCIEWIDNFLKTSNRKLLVYGIHKSTLKEVHQRFRSISVLVNGTMPTAKRQMAYDKFNSDKNCRLYVANIEAGGVGWSCRVADNIAFIEMDYRPTLHSQAIARCRGIKRGTGRPVTVWYLVANETIEVKLCEMHEGKSNNIDQIIDGKSFKQSNVFAFLVESLMRLGKPVPKRRQR